MWSLITICALLATAYIHYKEEYTISGTIIMGLLIMYVSHLCGLI